MLKMKMLMCGMALSEGRMGLAGEDKIATLREILKGMETIAEQTGTPIIAFKDFSPEYIPYLDSLRSEGFCKFNGFPVAELDIRFNSFADYLANLGGRMRQDLKRKLRKFDSLNDIELRVTDSLDGYLDHAYELYWQTLSYFPEIPF
jgi:predicted N-acyltransferase